MPGSSAVSRSDLLLALGGLSAPARSVARSGGLKNFSRLGIFSTLAQVQLNGIKRL